MSMDNRLCGLVPVPMIRVGFADNPGRLNMHKTGAHSILNRARKSDCLCILVFTKVFTCWHCNMHKTGTHIPSTVLATAIAFSY